MNSDDITLVIKNPASTLEEDFRLEVPANETVYGVKQRLRSEYQGQPNTACQRLIYCGQVLKDTSVLKEVFKNQDLEQPQILHLVVKPSPEAPSPLYRSLNPSAASIASSSTSSLSTFVPTQNSTPSAPQMTSTQGSSGSSGSGTRGPGDRVNIAPAPQVPTSSSTAPLPPQPTPLGDTQASQVPSSMSVHASAMLNPVYAAAYHAALAALSSPTSQPFYNAAFQNSSSSASYLNPNLQALMWMNSYYQQFPGMQSPFLSASNLNLFSGTSMPFHPSPFRASSFYGSGNLGRNGQPGSSQTQFSPAQFPPFPNYPPPPFPQPTQANPPAGDANAARGVPPGLAAVLPPGVTLARVRVVRIDVMLLLKLAAVVFILTQDGSRTRFWLICIAAFLFYLHQTGVIRPFQNWFVPRIVEGRGGAQMRAQELAQQREAAPAAGVQEGENQNTRPAEEERANDADNREGTSTDVDPQANTQMAGRRIGRLGMIGQEARILFIGFFTSLMPGFNPAQHIVPDVAARNHQD